MKFTLFDHCGKGMYLRQQLQTAGHELVEPAQADVVLLDCDWPWAHPRPEIIRQAHERDAAVVLYPHGGGLTSFVYDGLCDPDPGVVLRLEHGQGSIDALNRPELKQEATGWLFSPTLPFTPVENPARVLFAPRHPNIERLAGGLNGHDPGPTINQRIYKQLLKLDFDLVVSVVGQPWRNGVWQHPKTSLLPNPNMWFPNTYEQILACDVVVATGTVAYAAVALGKPVVMFDQADMCDYVNGQYVEADHADDYRDALRYPLDVEDAELQDLIGAASEGWPAVAEWRETWVGDEGTDHAIRLIEQVVDARRPEPPSKSVTIQGVAARGGVTTT